MLYYILQVGNQNQVEIDKNRFALFEGIESEHLVTFINAVGPNSEELFDKRILWLLTSIFIAIKTVQPLL